jgi:hypothetical protein
MKAFGFFLVLLLNFSSFDLWGQNYLVIKDKKKSYRIFQGQPFNYYLKGDSQLYRDILVDVREGRIVLQYLSMHPNNIYAIDIRDLKNSRSNFKNYSPLIILAGLGYFIVGHFNNDFIYDPRTTKSSLGLIGVGSIGLAAKILEKKKLKIDSSNNIILIDLSKPEAVPEVVTEMYD